MDSIRYIQLIDLSPFMFPCQILCQYHGHANSFRDLWGLECIYANCLQAMDGAFFGLLSHTLVRVTRNASCNIALFIGRGRDLRLQTRQSAKCVTLLCFNFFRCHINTYTRYLPPLIKILLHSTIKVGVRIMSFAYDSRRLSFIHSKGRTNFGTHNSRIVNGCVCQVSRGRGPPGNWSLFLGTSFVGFGLYSAAGSSHSSVSFPACVLGLSLW